MADRGKVLKLKLGKVIFFNQEFYTHALVEIDHVNYGLDPRTRRLNSKKRSNFSGADIARFVLELDEIDIMYKKEDAGTRFFEYELQCPLEGLYFDKRFRIILTTSKNEPSVLGIITLYRIK